MFGNLAPDYIDGHVLSRLHPASLRALDSMSDARTYRRRYDDVQAFLAALAHLLDACESSGNDAFGVSYPTWTPKPGREAEAARRAAEVDRAAGRAALALGREFFIEWKPRGTFQTQPVSPASGWRTILEYDPNFTVDVIFAVCNQALGVLEARAIEAEEHEQSLAGKVERVTRARRSRQPKEPDGHVRRALIASLVGIPSALLVAYLVYRFGWG